MWEDLQDDREQRGLFREAARPESWANWCNAAWAQLRDDAPGDRLLYAYRNYLRSPDFQAKNWPTALFMHPSIWQCRIPTRGAA